MCITGRRAVLHLVRPDLRLRRLGQQAAIWPRLLPRSVQRQRPGPSDQHLQQRRQGVSCLSLFLFFLPRFSLVDDSRGILLYDRSIIAIRNDHAGKYNIYVYTRPWIVFFGVVREPLERGHVIWYISLTLDDVGTNPLVLLSSLAKGLLGSDRTVCGRDSSSCLGIV